jgi:hypothetical protein
LSQRQLRLLDVNLTVPARTTPALLGLFSLVSLWTDDPAIRRLARPLYAAWYDKRTITFSDALAAVRRSLWAAAVFDASRRPANMTKPRSMF